MDVSSSTGDNRRKPEVSPPNPAPTRLERLTDLLARVRAADKASPEIDALVLAALAGPPGCWVEQSKINGAWCIYEPGHGGRERLWERRGQWYRPEGWPLTSSVDAALAMVERVLPGWRVKLSNVGDAWAYAELYHPGPPLTGRVSGWVFETAGEAKTLPTSVLAAILRVLIELNEAALSPQPGDS